MLNNFTKNKKNLFLLIFNLSLISSYYSISTIETMAKDTIINTSKNNRTLAPSISYTSEQIGDREQLKVTVTVSDNSGSGIKEFRDHNSNLIQGNSYTTTFSKRDNAIFTVIDNNGNKNSVKIDLNWINPFTTGIDSMKDFGSLYWSNSNIREWLNSDESTVSYTSNPPTDTLMGSGKGYDKEPGFLNQFSSEEKNAIATTEHRIFLSSIFSTARDGGNGDMGYANNQGAVFLGTYPHFADNYKNYRYKKELDKVFILNGSEMYHYLYKRGFSFTKYLTSEAKNKHKLSNTTYDWWVQGSNTWSGKELGYKTSGDQRLTNSDGQDWLGIVPVIHLKPNYMLQNGVLSNNLKIGDVIIFGKYLNKPIEWQVINITDNNYPLLISKNILDIKKFDAKGDKSRMYSDYILLNSPDVSIVDDLQFKSTKGSLDTEIPYMQVVDETNLKKRHNDNFSLDFKAGDNGGSGIDYIILPNGEKITDTNFSYTFSSNKIYNFQLMDNAGNYTGFSVPVGNINDKPETSISASSTEWSNKDVYIDIKSSNNVSYRTQDRVFNNRIESAFNYFPNYVSYVGSEFEISGQVSIINYTEKARGAGVRIGLLYDVYKTNSYGYQVNNSSSMVKVVDINELIEKGTISFQTKITVPNTYFANLRTYIIIDGGGVTVGETDHVLSVKIDKLESKIIDDSDFAITSIILPDGSEIKDVKEYTDIIRTDGIHTLKYKVLDNRGVTTERTITVKIDKTPPTLDIDYNTFFTSENLPISITASDTLSGFKRIHLPNSNYSSQSSITYTVTENNSYIFKSEDVAGNITTKVININNIDKIPPILNYKVLYSDDKSYAILNVTAEDNGSGLKEFKDYQNNTANGNNYLVNINKNGNYMFTAEDFSGNITVINVHITELTEESSSGIKNIQCKLEGAITKDWAICTSGFELANEGTTIVTAKSYDVAGNVSSEVKLEVKIDKTKPANNQLTIKVL